MSSAAVPTTDPTTTSTRITNPTLLTLARGLWVVFALLVILSNIARVPQIFERQICVESEGNCFHNNRQIPQPEVDLLTSAGIDYHILVVIESVILIAVYAAFIAIALLIFWKRSDDRMALLLSAALLANLNFSPLVYNIGSLVIPAAFLIFPTGRFQPFLPTIIIYLMIAIGASLTNFNIPTPGIPLATLLNLIGTLASLVLVAYRYFRVLNQTQRQQAKWVFLVFICTPLYYLTDILFIVPILTALGNQPLLIIHLFVLNILSSGTLLIIPIAFWIAITRYRLFDLNFVINRSLVYGIVTVVLFALFALLFAVIHAALNSVVSGQQGFIAGAIAVAVPVLLFNPVRHAVGHVVDQRVFRLRFDLHEVAAAQKKPDIKNPGLYTGRTFGKYEVLGVLGKGGMGEVYKGYGGGQTVALKVLPEDLARKDEFRKRFEREAQTLSSLQHPNIVHLYDSGLSDDGVHYLAMEYIDGQELSEVISAGGLTDYEALREWIRSVAAALDYIHAKGLVHRDLKPSNIMLRPSTTDKEIKEAVLMDFGIARVDASGTRITGSGAVGTIDYMSPEQIMTAREVDKRSDIYALGIIVYELLTGERPFKGGAGQVLFAHLQQPAPDPRDTQSNIPRNMAHAVMQALSKKPEERFESAGAFASAL